MVELEHSIRLAVADPPSESPARPTNPAPPPGERYDPGYDTDLPNCFGKTNSRGKPPLSWVPAAAMEAIVRPLVWAEEHDYGDHRNWMRGIPASELLGCISRHIADVAAGKRKDDRTGLDPVDQLICRAMMLAWMVKHRPDLDDRDVAAPAVDP